MIPMEVLVSRLTTIAHLERFWISLVLGVLPFLALAWAKRTSGDRKSIEIISIVAGAIWALAIVYFALSWSRCDDKTYRFLSDAHWKFFFDWQYSLIYHWPVVACALTVAIGLVAGFLIIDKRTQMRWLNRSVAVTVVLSSVLYPVLQFLTSNPTRENLSLANHALSSGDKQAGLKYSDQLIDSLPNFDPTTDLCNLLPARCRQDLVDLVFALKQCGENQKADRVVTAVCTSKAFQTETSNFRYELACKLMYKGKMWDEALEQLNLALIPLPSDRRAHAKEDELHCGSYPLSSGTIRCAIAACYIHTNRSKEAHQLIIQLKQKDPYGSQGFNQENWTIIADAYYDLGLKDQLKDYCELMSSAGYSSDVEYYFKRKSGSPGAL